MLPEDKHITQQNRTQPSSGLTQICPRDSEQNNVKAIKREIVGFSTKDVGIMGQYSKTAK